MKKKACFLPILIITAWSIALPGLSQQLKIGVFDLDAMVHALPEYRTIDSLMIIYEDSASAAYDILVNELSKIDRLFRGYHQQFDKA